jgi:hypothetical protein
MISVCQQGGAITCAQRSASGFSAPLVRALNCQASKWQQHSLLRRCDPHIVCSVGSCAIGKHLLTPFDTVSYLITNVLRH